MGCGRDCCPAVLDAHFPYGHCQTIISPAVVTSKCGRWMEQLLPSPCKELVVPVWLRSKCLYLRPRPTRFWICVRPLTCPRLSAWWTISGQLFFLIWSDSVLRCCHSLACGTAGKACYWGWHYPESFARMLANSGKFSDLLLPGGKSWHKNMIFFASEVAVTWPFCSPAFLALVCAKKPRESGKSQPSGRYQSEWYALEMIPSQPIMDNLISACQPE